MFKELASQKLQQAGFKLTKPRIQLIEFFHKHTEAVSPYDIVKAQPELDVVSVYRTLEILESLHLIHKIWSLGGYVRCNLHENNHCEENCCHEFQVCTHCKEYKELHGHHKHSLNTSSFHINQHISEQVGTCNKCKN